MFIDKMEDTSLHILKIYIKYERHKFQEDLRFCK